MAKILEIGNYPPPMCGWAIQTKLLVVELRRRRHICDVLNINESRRIKSEEYVDVQNGPDYVAKLLRFASSGYRFHMHVNGGSPKGYLLALLAVSVGRLFGRPAVLSFHGGIPQNYFPRSEVPHLRWAFQLLFRLAGSVTCDSPEIKRAIEAYGIAASKVAAIPCFSSELLEYSPAPLNEEVESFLGRRQPVFFCYVSFRPEYRLAMLREAMVRFRRMHPAAGFIWLGFPAKEMPPAREFVGDWPAEEARSLLLLGNVTHDEFCTLMSRCFACIRTPACDGVSASVMESLAMGVPVVASENGRRPSGVLTYSELDAQDLCSKLLFLVEQYAAIKDQTRLDGVRSNTKLAADWLLGETGAGDPDELDHVA